MPTPTKGPRLGGSPAHERLMLANLATALFEHGRITTTEAKAKRLRPLAERLITIAKRGDLHARRQVLTVIRDKSVVHTLFTEIGPRYENRPGGYTRITKIGPRKGDNAPMAVIELVEALTARGRGRRGRGRDQAHRRKGAKKEAGTRAAANRQRQSQPQRTPPSRPPRRLPTTRPRVTRRRREAAAEARAAADDAAVADSPTTPRSPRRPARPRRSPNRRGRRRRRHEGRVRAGPAT